MTEQDLERLKKRLLEQRQEVFRLQQDLDEDWHEMSVRDIEIEEEAQKAALTELFVQLDERGQSEVEEIDLALTKMVNATYGTCEACQKSIPLERLLSLPATRYCFKCSTKEEEKRQKPLALA